MNKIIDVDTSKVDEAKAVEACMTLVEAYARGEENGASIDLEDVERVVAMASQALPGTLEAVRAAMDALISDDEAFRDLEVRPTTALSGAGLACLTMIFACRTGDIEWEDLDAAHEAAMKAIVPVPAP